MLGVSPATRADTCTMPNAAGTADLPLAGCEYTAPFEPFVIIDGLPVGSTIVLEPVLKSFQCTAGSFAFCTVPVVPGVCESPGGVLGGTVACSRAELELTVSGTGALAGFNRFLTMQVEVETHQAPRNPVDAVETLATRVVRIRGEIFGDPDFDLLRVEAGDDFGLPSPGVMEIAEKHDGNQRAEETLGLTYRFTFQGAPGSILDGMAGVTQASLAFEVGTNVCPVPDGGAGTPELPPLTCDYVNDDPLEIYQILDGLPAGTTIELEPLHHNFICGNPLGQCSVALAPGQCETAGGTLGGTVSCHESTLNLYVRGTNLLAGFNRILALPLDGEMHFGPRNPGDPIQSFPSQLMRWQGEIFGDPDFCTFRFWAGDQYGLPSPGAILLTDMGASTFAVDSFLDVNYEIEFQGCPGSQLEGFGGITTGSIRLSTGEQIEFDPVPGLTGGWLWLAAALLAMSSVWVIRERAVQR